VQFAEQMEVPMPVQTAAAPVVAEEVVAPTMVAALVETVMVTETLLIEEPNAAPEPVPAQAPVVEQPAASTGTDGAAAPRPSRSRRASVPAWDDIMFGAKRSD
jgi:hypothetical protein